MDLDNMTIGELKKIQALLGTNKKPKEICNGGIRIIVLQRGWVVIGRFSQHGSECKIKDGFVIRNWGTEKGLGQLALDGPQANTKLDTTPDISYHELTAVLSIQCKEKKWLSKFPR